MDQQQFEATLADAEIRLRRLRALYDQWFHGLERSEPQNQKFEIDRKIADMRRSQPRNTALRFRFNQLVQRYTTYTSYWQRITRQIEEGTYKRDVLRAKRRFGEGGAGRERQNAHDGYELDIDIDIEAALDGAKSERPSDGSSAGATRSSRPPPNSDRPQRAQREITPFAQPDGPASSGLPNQGHAAAPARKPPPALASPSGRAVVASRQGANAAGNGLSDEQIQGIYQRYLAARRDNNERVDNVKLETVAKTVRDMLPKLAQKHAGKQIEFEVVVKDGRVALKPRAK